MQTKSGKIFIINKIYECPEEFAGTTLTAELRNLGLEVIETGWEYDFPLVDIINEDDHIVALIKKEQIGDFEKILKEKHNGKNFRQLAINIDDSFSWHDLSNLSS